MGLPPGNWFLNSKERKKILQALREQFGVTELPEIVFIQNAKDKVYVINRDIERIPYNSIYIDSLGLYFGSWHIDGFRLSMEGAQLMNERCKENVLTLTDEQKIMWLKGVDIPWEKTDKNYFVIVKHKNNILGCGKLRKPREGKNEETYIMNYVPKARRLVVVNE